MVYELTILRILNLAAEESMLARCNDIINWMSLFHQILHWIAELIPEGVRDVPAMFPGSLLFCRPDPLTKV